MFLFFEFFFEFLVGVLEERERRGEELREEKEIFL